MKTFLPLAVLVLLPTLATAQENPLAEALRGDATAKRLALAGLWGKAADEKLFPLLREAMKDTDPPCANWRQARWRGRGSQTRP